MCGINGFTYNDQEMVVGMNTAIKHRGPDDSGAYVDDHVSLGHVRLSILDLSPRGHQPMVNASGDVWIVFNGEIYNFREIKDDLLKKGYVFKSETDTEVLLYGFEEYGEDLFQRLNGIFAFCLYKKSENAIYLVRDRVGIKPLYYTIVDKVLYFSSELKGLYATGKVPATVDAILCEEYLQSNNLYNESFDSKILPVMPGSAIVFDLKKKKLELKTFCRLQDIITKERYEISKRKSRGDLVAELDTLLHAVVQDQLASDAPLGTICSGGLDSSLISAIAARYQNGIKLFNVKVDDVALDESMYARKVADYLKLELVEEVLTKKEYLEFYLQCIWLEDLPLTHPNSVGIYLVSKRAKKEGISVLLSGEGADELMGGYHRYKAFRKRLLVSGLPLVNHFFEKRHKLFKDPELIGSVLDNKMFAAELASNPWLQKRMQKTEDFREAYAFISSDQERQLKAFIAKDIQYYLPPILRRTDRMSMGAGLEMRVPFLDNRILEFALNIPVKHQASTGTLKILLKKVAERYLPRDIVHRAKRGFPLPIDAWLQTNNYREMMLAQWKEPVSAATVS